jgi:hypothetical protein
MRRIVVLALVVQAIVGVLAAGMSPALAQDSFQALLEADVTAVETKLQLTGDEKTQVDAILQDGIKQRLAVLDKLGVTYGKKPSFSTLLKLRSQMDDIRTEQQTELAKILSEDQMFVVDQMAQESEQKFRAVLLGS